MARTNKDKDTTDPIIEEVLEETDPPAIEDPIENDPTAGEDPIDDLLPDPDNPEEVPEVITSEPVKPTPEPEDDKEKRYRAQQAETQIQVEKNKAIAQRVEEAQGVIIPTEGDLRTYATQEGLSWDEMTTVEQLMLKKTYIADKKFAMVQEVVESSKKVDEFAKSVDEFIDSTDGKPEYVDLSGHELEFRKYAMKDSHRGTPMDVLLGAFLHSLPPKSKVRGSMFETGGGGEKPKPSTDNITDAEYVNKLRTSNPREYRRLVKAKKIKIEA
jgi:hypothetical protein